MTRTPEQLRVMTENLKKGILQLVGELKKVTAESAAAEQAHNAAVEDLKVRHEQELAQLNASYEDMSALVNENTAFIEAIEQLFAE